MEEGLAVLKTLGNHFAMINKVDVPEAEGNAFDAYRKKVASGSRGGSPRPTNVVRIPLTFESLGLGAHTRDAILTLNRKMEELGNANSQIIAVIASPLRVLANGRLMLRSHSSDSLEPFFYSRSVIGEPSLTQLGGLSIFVLFVLAYPG